MALSRPNRPRRAYKKHALHRSALRLALEFVKKHPRMDRNGRIELGEVQEGMKRPHYLELVDLIVKDQRLAELMKSREENVADQVIQYALQKTKGDKRKAIYFLNRVKKQFEKVKYSKMAFFEPSQLKAIARRMQLNEKESNHFTAGLAHSLVGPTIKGFGILSFCIRKLGRG